MTYDTIIIGGGLSGLMCGIELIEKGQNVAIISSGQSALHFSSGAFELLGGCKHPLDKIDSLSEIHPYRIIGKEKMEAWTERGKAILKSAGIKVNGDAKKNHYRLTPFGDIKPAWLSIDDYATIEDTEDIPWKKVAIVTIDNYLDFYPEFIASGLAKYNVKSSIHSFTLPQFETLRKSSTEMRAANFARTITSAVIKGMSCKLNELLTDEDIILMPALIGLNYSSLVEELRAQVKKPVYFIPTIPASVPGIRAQVMLRNYFKRLGGAYFLGDVVTEGRIENNELISISTHNHNNHDFRAKNYVLASGSFFSKGLVATQDRIVESIFNLDVDAPGEREKWYDKDLYENQPYMQFGVTTNTSFQPYLNGEIVTNLYACGSILANQNALKDGCGGGVAITTALHVADLIINNIK